MHRDEGFSLSELLTVVALLGVILAISYGGLQAVYASREASDRQASFAREVSSPMLRMEDIISQALVLEAPGPYTFSVLTDRNNDDVLERHRFTATASGIVRYEQWLTDAARVNASVESNEVWSEHNTNVADATPFMEYYDRAGNRIVDMGLVPTTARSVRVVMNIEIEEREFGDTRTIMMRNR